MESKERKKRLGVFVFYDKDGIVDDYVIYLLNDLKENLDRLVIVCNGALTPDGRDRLEKISPEVYVHENHGYDVGAYKAAFDDYVGWDEILQYDELVLCNDTFYGPFWPFKQVFAKMEERPKLDFWGLTVHSKMVGSYWKEHSNYGYLPEHLQSYFLVVRNRLLHAREFRLYWDKIDLDFDTVDGAIANFETTFTKTFSDAGFRWAPYADTRALDDKKNQYIFNRNVYDCADLITKFGCPVLKRRAFIWDNLLEASDGGNTARAMKYIEENTSYDTQMIYKHQLRISSLSLLKRNLHWNYPLSKTQELPGEPIRPGTALVVFHMYYPDLVDADLQYLMQLPAGVDLLVTTSNDELDREYVCQKLSGLPGKFLGLMDAPKRGRDIAAFLVAARETMKNYEFACFTHDKKMSKEAHYSTIGENFRELINENVLASGTYVTNVLHLFQKNPSLGVVAPPPPFMGGYLNSVGDAWQGNFKCAKELMKKLGLAYNLSRKEQPYILGTSLWFRTKALKPLLDYPFTENDLPGEPLPADGTVSHAVERIFPYVAQSQGYYSGWIMTEDYASLYLEQYTYMMSGVLGEWSCRFPPFTGYEAFMNGYKDLLGEYTRNANEKRSGVKVWGAREAFYAWDEDLMRAASLAENQEEADLYTIGFESAWEVFRISLSVWFKKHSPSKLNRKLGRFMAVQKMPSVSQTWWLVRKTFVVWVRKKLHLA